LALGGIDSARSLLTTSRENLPPGIEPEPVTLFGCASIVPGMPCTP